MWAEAGLEQLCCHIPWCRSCAAGLVCIYSRGSVHSTRQFLIYRLGGAGAAPTLSQAQTSSYGGERRSQLRTGESWAKALRALRCESISSRTLRALLRRPWLQRSPLLSPEARGSPVPKRLPLPPGSRASLPRPRFPACLLLPPPSTCCRLRELLLAPSACGQSLGTAARGAVLLGCRGSTPRILQPVGANVAVPKGIAGAT